MINATRLLVTPNAGKCYSREVLIDPRNFENYELLTTDDEGFAEFIGSDQETVNRMNNASNEPHINLFTAKMFRLMYQILSVYTISKNNIMYNRVRRDIIKPIEDNKVTRDVREFYHSDLLLPIGSTPSNDWVLANDLAYTNYTSQPLIKSKFLDFPIDNANPNTQLSYLRNRKNQAAAKSTGLYESRDGHALVWSFKNLDDTSVNVDFSMYGILKNNSKGVAPITFFNQAPFTYYDSFDARFPRVDPGDAQQIVNINNLKSNSVLGGDGYITLFSSSGNNPAEFMPKDNDFTDLGFTDPAQQSIFSMRAADFVFGDSNSPGFDYFMEPGAFPELI